MNTPIMDEQSQIEALKRERDEYRFQVMAIKESTAIKAITPQPRYSQEYCDLLNAMRDFEIAHKAWMNLSVFTPEGEAAKQYKNSCAARYTEARRSWERSLLDAIRQEMKK